MARSRRQGFCIREGDTWLFQSNDSVMVRKIVGIEGPEIRNRRVYYTDYGGTFHSCLLTTFRRWWRGAEIDFATDWSGRDSRGDLLLAATENAQEPPHA